MGVFYVCLELGLNCRGWVVLCVFVRLFRFCCCYAQGVGFCDLGLKAWMIVGYACVGFGGGGVWIVAWIGWF